MRSSVKQRNPAEIRLKAITYAATTKATQEQAEGGTDDQHYLTPATGKVSVEENAPPLINERISRPRLFRRKKFREVPYYNSVLVGLLTTYSYPYLHPQAIAIDSTAGEIWVLSGPPSGAGANDWGWFSVYDIATGARKVTFTLAVKWSESCILERDGANRYLWTFSGTSFVKADVTTLPADGATVTPSLSVGVSGQNGQASFDGQTFSLQIGFSTTGRRETFGRFNKSLARVGTVEFPAMVTGNINGDYINYLPKSQGVAAFNGGYVFGCGAAYTPGSYTASQLQGLQVASEDGTLIESALCRPDEFLQTLSTVAGRTLSIVESEGVYVEAGEIYECWMIQPVATRLTDGLTGGILITKGYTADEDAVDFSPAAETAPVPFDRLTFETQVYVSSSQLRDPVTQATLNTFDQIADMMRALNISRYAFLGTNQSLTDVNGETVPNVSGNLVEFVNKGTSIDVFITRARDKTHYLIGGTSPRSQQFLREVPHAPGCASYEIAQDVLQISSPWIYSTIAATSSVAGSIKMLRIPLSPQQRLRNFTQMGVDVTTVGTLTAHLGVYADNGGRPGVLLLDAGTADLTATGPRLTAAFTSQRFDYEAIYLAIETEDSTARLTRVLQVYGALGGFNGASISNGINRSRTFSATFPPDESSSSYSNTTIMPLIWLQ